MAAFTEIEIMDRALNLACRGKGKTLPNPMVGAVIVKNGQIVGEGYHQGPGKPHAEVVAIKKAGTKAKGSTLYVTLEPCCHTGKTGPCSEAIIESGIKNVIYAATDPNPLVNGKGARTLSRAGVKVSNGLLSERAARLNEVYSTLIKSNRPFVTLKIAQSLDGRLATISGDSKWISSKESRQFAHKLRREADAIVIGAGTLRQDNPQLTTRLVKGKNPYRIIAAGSKALPSNCKLLKENSDHRTIIAASGNSSGKKSLYRKNLTIWNVTRGKRNRLDLHDFLGKAKDFGINSILVEGGAQLATSFLKAGLVDKLIVITAPIVIGQGKESVGELDIRKITGAIRFGNSYWTHIGPDSVFIGYPDWGK